MSMKTHTRVLLVEDEPLIAMMLESYLEEIGMQVVGIAIGVDDALEFTGLGGIDIAIVDVNLSGGQRCDPVADDLARRGIPFILASGDHVAPAPWHDRPLLCKPYTMSDLEAVVTDVLQSVNA